MRRGLSVLALVVLAGALAPGGVPGVLADGRRLHHEREEREHAHGPARVRFAALTHDGKARHGTHFSVARVRDLVIVVDWRTLVGPHTQRLDVLAPDGAVYQRFTAPVESVDGRARVETRLPVGGTWITERSLLGRWRVRVYLDDATTPVAVAGVVLAR